jgi:Adenylate kinase and related kinases
MKQKIHIFGASGSGTTTIAKNVCSKLDYTHFDSDNYFWENTIEPFTVERNRNECLQLMEDDLLNRDKWILSGSLSGWGNKTVL